MILVERRERLTPADHQTHRRYPFAVPEVCTRLTFLVRYGPKFLSPADSAALVREAVAAQQAEFADRVGTTLAHVWAKPYADVELIVPNLLTISVDDAVGTYRGAAHRHSPNQELTLAPNGASPGLVAGDLPAGKWLLTLTTHTLVSPHCDLEIQIGAETA